MCFFCYRGTAKIPVLSLTKLIEREKHRLAPTPRPVSVSAVRGPANEEKSVTTPVEPEDDNISSTQSQSTSEKSSAPDYFYDDISV